MVRVRLGTWEMYYILSLHKGRNMMMCVVCNLEDSGRQVGDDEGGRHSSVTPLQQVDDIKEEEVTWDHKDQQDSG